VARAEGSRPKAGVNGAGRRFCFETAKSSKGKDLRPCLHEYHRPIVFAPRSTSCSPPIVRCPRSWRRWPGLAHKLLMQAALEAEVTEFLGRDRYQRTAATPDAQPGARNGYRPATVKTTAGPVTLERPKLRGTTAAFASRLFGKHVTKTHALESLVIASFVRGLSVRDGRGHPGRCARGSGRDLEIDCLAGMPSDQDRVRHLGGPPPR
jgi:Transposase, Mutator family